MTALEGMFSADAFDPSKDDVKQSKKLNNAVEFFGIGDGYDADGVWDFTNVIYMQDPDTMELEQLVMLIKTQKKLFGLLSPEELADEEKLSVDPIAFER